MNGYFFILDATLLPPLKLKKDASEFDNVVEELKVNESEETPILLEKGHNEPEEFDTKSNTESNLNEEIISHDDDINNEIQEHKSESISYNNSEKEEEERSIKELDEAENDLVITRKESAMKRFFSVFKGKKSSAKASTEEISKF